MGSGPSNPVHHEDTDDDPDYFKILSEASRAQRTKEIRLEKFPIDFPIDEAVVFDYKAFISPDSSSLLPTLPSELIDNIVRFLDNRSIKNLRLTCRLFSVINLRINRVFLSANPLNIHVLLSIADHDVYRQGIVELIYDDARLYHSRADQGNKPFAESVALIDMFDPLTTKEWFQVERNINLDELQQRGMRDEPNRPQKLKLYRQIHAELSHGESWVYYQELLRQQDDVIFRGADVEAFRYALRRFPALRTVTVTPAAHGWLFTPLYATPMIRAFPYGFNYPIPRGWPIIRSLEENEWLAPWEESKARWRGYCLITQVLAQERQNHRISELRIDSHYLQSGLNPRLFKQQSPEYLDSITCLQLPSLKKLHLSLYVDFQWTAFRRSLLRNALAKSPQLEHFSLETGLNRENYNPNYIDYQEWPPVLQTILPINCWTRLQHFRLWNFPVDPADLISALSQFPALQSLELGCLFLKSGTHRELLENMRNILRWHERPTQPKVRYAVPTYPHGCHKIQGRAIWIDEEVEKFFYSGGENPFENNAGNQVCYDIGVMKDAYDPEYERPHLHPAKYSELLEERWNMYVEKLNKSG